MTTRRTQNGDFVPGEYKLQHTGQLGQPCQRGTQLSVLWKNLFLESSLGEAHRDDAQGLDKDFKAGFNIAVISLPS